MPDLLTTLRRRQPHVVGSIAGPETLSSPLLESDCDLIELRLDSLGTGPNVRAFAERQRDRHPVLLTARHPNEGGQNNMSSAERAAALEPLLEVAALVDLELQSLAELAPTWERAASAGVIRVASRHDFEACPPLDELRATVRAMKDGGAEVAKIAVRIVEPGDLQTLVDLLRHDSPLPLAVMGMGPLAPSSRLLAAQLGSVLNYGYLGREPTAPGQWPARLLKEAIAQSGEA